MKSKEGSINKHKFLFTVSDIENLILKTLNSLQATNQNLADEDCLKITQTIFKEVHVQVNNYESNLYFCKSR